MAVSQRATDLGITFGKLFFNDNGNRDSRRFASVTCATKSFTEILVEENFPGCNELGPTFHYFKSEDTLNKLFHWCRSYGNCTKETTFLLLDMYRSLFSTASTMVLRDRFILLPFNRLLIDLRPKDKQQLPFDVEMSLLSVVDSFIARLLLDSELLKCCSSEERNDTGVYIPKYAFFSTILYFIYIDGELGSMARKMIIDCIRMSSTDLEFANFIGKESSCCAILAAGLSGLFSTLPTSLSIDNKDWCGISREDCPRIPALNDFLEALHMCCVVSRVKQGNISPSLLALIHDGFLISVLTPALFQSSVESKTSTVAYIDLFLRSINEPEMLKIFLKWILLESYEDYSILDLLISHLYLPSIHLCMVTIHLFRTLVELNCEDVMYHLILRYLIPCNHVLPNQKRKIKELDFYCKSANMFLYLTPTCCLEAEDEMASQCPNDSPVDGEETESGLVSLLQFDDYLRDCRSTIRSCKQACTCWTSVYDGTDVMTEYPSRMSRCASDGSASSLDQSHGSYKEQLMLPDNVTANSHTTDCLGPFLNALFDKLEKMAENYPYVNLQLTALVSRIACYPQPLLRSFLLSSTVVLHQGVRSLIQTISAASYRTNASIVVLESYRSHLKQSRDVFVRRASYLLDQSCEINVSYGNGSILDDVTEQTFIEETSQASLSSGDALRAISSRTFSLTADEPDPDVCVSVSFAPQQKAAIGRLHPVIRYGPKEKSSRPIEPNVTVKRQSFRKHDVATKNLFYCAVVLEEWLKELAAISLEHNLV